MSLMTTWSTDHVPAPPLAPAPRRPLRGPQPAWDCANCGLLNAGARRRCTECGTRCAQR